MLCISLRLVCSLVCTPLKAFTHIDTRIQKGWDFFKNYLKSKREIIGRILIYIPSSGWTVYRGNAARKTQAA
jgi:hypothetical protein